MHAPDLIPADATASSTSTSTATRPTTRLRQALGASALFAFSLAPAFASCGATSCNLLNDRFALGTWEHPGWSVDVRLESLTQSQLREGTKNLGPSDLPPGEEAIERHTRNRTLVTTLDYAASQEWSFALRLPGVHRDHLHDVLDEDTGEIAATERWRFTRLGDVQALARWQAPAGNSDFSWALTAGVKLPTGSHRVANAEVSLAERALQPGTGTTDLILGASTRQVLGTADALNLQLTWTQALGAADDFSPGARLDASAGWAHAVSHGWSTLLQLNFTQRGRDIGANAEPALSGSSRVSLSPGASFAVSKADTVYGLIQLPIYQKVNGIQLVPVSSLALGWTHAF